MTRLERHWPAQLASHTALRDRLVACYMAPHRAYHDTRHLAEVLGNVDLLLDRPIGAAVDRDAVVLAAWFHDAVYDGQPDDEERSARLAESTLTQAGVPDPLVAEVARLVRLTREHHPDEGDLAGHVLCDADLAVLAARPERYEEYVRDVRREYGHLDESTFRVGRAELLEALLAKPHLFHTDYGQDTWEGAARANVQRELRSLRDR